MSIILKKLFFLVTFNSFLFILLIIGIQNSSNKKRVNFIVNETVKLPVSFIVGSSFVSGSILGSFLSINFADKK